MQCSDLYAEAYSNMQVGTVKPIWDKVRVRSKNQGPQNGGTRAMKIDELMTFGKENSHFLTKL